jgi:general secretion pathway protein G
MKRKNKRPLTLLEMMIVICLITLITGVIGYNMKGSLDKGRAFRTVQAQQQLHDLLLLALADGEPMATIMDGPENVIRRLGLAKDPEKILKDGWGEPFEIKTKGKSDFTIKSQHLIEYEAKQKRGQLRSVQDEPNDD